MTVKLHPGGGSGRIVLLENMAASELPLVLDGGIDGYHCYDLVSEASNDGRSME